MPATIARRTQRGPLIAWVGVLSSTPSRPAPLLSTTASLSRAPPSAVSTLLWEKSHAAHSEDQNTAKAQQRIAVLEAEKTEAVRIENYSAAKALKEEILSLRAMLAARDETLPAPAQSSVLRGGVAGAEGGYYQGNQEGMGADAGAMGKNTSSCPPGSYASAPRGDYKSNQ